MYYRYMEIYLENPTEFYVKKNVCHREYFIQKYVYQLGIVNVPEIIKYDETTNTMVMRNVGKDNISNIYGENAIDVPDEIFDQVVKIVRKLVLHGIKYPDLTGYNFVEGSKQKIWIIDFEHATLKTPEQVVNNEHIRSICNGCKEWNPDFR